MYPFSYRNYRNNYIDSSEISKLIDQDVQLIDLRSKEEYAKEHIRNFINIPYHLLYNNLAIIDKNKPVYFICALGKQSLEASQYLNQLGYKAFSFIGGMHNYKFTYDSNYL